MRSITYCEARSKELEPLCPQKSTFKSTSPKTLPPPAHSARDPRPLPAPNTITKAHPLRPLPGLFFYTHSESPSTLDSPTHREHNSPQITCKGGHKS